MKYAVVSHNGKQVKVQEGDSVSIDLLNIKPNENFIFKDILLVVDEKMRKVGSPTVSGASVKATIIAHKKGKKVRVANFKAKARFRRVNGFRAKLTTLKIEKILTK